MSLIILFGLPGTGKTYVGKVLAEHFQYYFYDGDEDIPEDMQKTLKQNLPVTPAMRDAFFKRINERIHVLQTSYEKIVVAQTFIKEIYREDLLKTFPAARFLLVQTDDSIREQRLGERHDYPLDLEYSRQMVINFDPPKVTHSVIANTSSGTKELISQLNAVV